MKLVEISLVLYVEVVIKTLTMFRESCHILYVQT
jgi:hypothetical protein